MSGTHSLVELGRKIRVGFVGGGLDSVIGATHLYALRLDGLAEVTAGAFSIDPDIAADTGRSLLVDPHRVYKSWRDMLAAESGRDDGVDIVVVITPPDLHAEISIAFLDRGIHVLTEKPMTATLQQARQLVAAAERSSALFAVTHCYTGFPMVREARSLVRAGALGRVRLIEGQFAGGELGVLREPQESSARHWRFRINSMGKASVLGEVGTHIHNMVEFVTGERVTDVSARMSIIAQRREVFDNAYLDIETTSGATGRLWSSFTAAGIEHGLMFQISGDDGTLVWREEEPEYLWLHRPGQAASRLSRAQDDTGDTSRASTRIRPGHPEGYLAAFANIYRDFILAVLETKQGRDPCRYLENIPDARDGLSTMALIDAAISSQEGGSSPRKLQPE